MRYGEDSVRISTNGFMNSPKLNWTQMLLGRVGYNPSQPSPWSCRWYVWENIDPRRSDEGLLLFCCFVLLLK